MKILDYNVIKRLPESIARAGCFVLNMPNDTYHAFAGISKSGLDLIAKSPAEYNARTSKDPTRAMAIGTAIHAAILEPERFDEEYYLGYDIDKRTSSEYKQLSKIHGADFVLTKTESENVIAMRKQAHTSREIMEHISHKDTLFEVSAFIEDPETKALIRCRFDSLNFTLNSAPDIKKTADAHQEEFEKSASKYRYHVQAAMYSHIYKLLTGNELYFPFVALQETAPHTCFILPFDEYSLMIGDYYFKKDLKKYTECYKINAWPHPDKRKELTLSHWEISKYETEVDELMMSEFEGSE